MKYQLKDLKRHVNTLGKRDNIYEKYIFISFERNEKSIILVTIYNKKRDSIKKMRFNYLKKYPNPFSIKRDIPLPYLIKEVNKLGLLNENKYKRFKYVDFYKKNSIRYVKVSNLHSKEMKSIQLTTLRAGHNPFTKRSLVSWESEIKAKINKIGRTFTKYEKYRFSKLISKTKEYDFLVEIQNISDGVLKTTRFFELMRRRNPFAKTHYSSKKLIEKVTNQFGKKSKFKLEKFKYVKDEFYNKKIRVTIENTVTKEIKLINFDSLKKGVNPFRLYPQRIEENIINPQIKKIFDEHNTIKILKYNNYMGKYRPDFIIEVNENIYIIENKSDSSYWRPKELKEQILKYHREAKKIYKKKYKKTYLTSLNGTYGISVKELLNILLTKV